MSQRKPGTVITFYSYKGGTGRSMALANVAWILAAGGNDVLVLDWDLEAPGLHRYFHPFLRDKQLTASEGVIDFVTDMAVRAATREDSAKSDWYVEPSDFLRYAVSLEYDHENFGTIDLVPAGRQGPDYAVRVNSFDWHHFYESLGGGIFLESARQKVLAAYDYILVDSRTGVSDTSGVCTVHLPDVLAVCFTLNRQSIEGAAAVAESVHQQRMKDDGTPGIRIFPIPTRVERGETTRVELARQDAIQKFEGFLWHIEKPAREKYWREVEVPYEPFYAYEEVLAVFADATPTEGSQLAAMQVIAKHLTGGAVTSMAPLVEAERLKWKNAYLRQAPAVVAPRPPIQKADRHAVDEKRPPEVAARVTAPPYIRRGNYLCYFSYARRDAEGGYLERFLKDLADEVRAYTGIKDPIFFDSLAIHPLDDWKQLIAEAIANSFIFMPCLSPSYFTTMRCGKEFQLYLLRSQQPSGMGLLPLVWVPPVRELPPAIRQVPLVSDDMPRPYQKRGLRAISRLRQTKDYARVVQVLTRNIANQAANHSTGPAPGGLPDFDKVPNAFEGTESQAGRAVGVVYLAGAKSEMKDLRSDLSQYDGSGREWRPWPNSKLSVGMAIQQALGNLDYSYFEVTIRPGILDEIAGSTMLIVIVDPWSLRIGKYAALARELDNRSSNVAALAAVDQRGPAIPEDVLRVNFPTLQQTRLFSVANSMDGLLKAFDQSIEILRARLAENRAARNQKVPPIVRGSA
jgi:MinD-like ATPase involved in chromosome partitioning or flagellar assembly